MVSKIVQPWDGRNSCWGARTVSRGAAGLLTSLLLMTASGDAQAVQLPAELRGRPDLEIASGEPVRSHRVFTVHQVPSQHSGAWRRVQNELGTAHGFWDPHTHVPSRIVGTPIHVPGAVASEIVAARAAEAFLSRHIALLAPGAAPSDFSLVSNDLDAGMRTVGFRQHHRDLRVLGGQLSFRFKNDRLFLIATDALPDVSSAIPGRTVSPQQARVRARAWVLSDSARTAQASTVDGPFILPLIRAGGVSYRTVLRVRVAGQQPLGQWDVYVDASDGAPVARRQRIAFADGQLLFNAPERRPGATRADYPAAFADLTIDGSDATTAIDGGLSWSGTGSASLGVEPSGTFAHVYNQAGQAAGASLSIVPDGQVVWNAADSQYTDAQLTAFIHTNRVVEYVRGFASLPYSDTQVQVYVNINDSCNAYYDGDSINFFRASGGCGNTGRLADVIYHEYGHSLHDHGIIEGVGAWDSALSDGRGDYLATTITGDSAMGRGFWGTTEPLRETDPEGWEHVWPDDIGEIHWTGLIIAGALWDARQQLVLELGEDEARTVADPFFYQAMRRAVDIPSMYLEALAADDDDGDLTNGTPHVCAINAGFAPHGLRHVSAQASPVAIAPPHLDGYAVGLGLIGMYGDCPSDQIGTAIVEWKLRDSPDTGGELDMDLSSNGFVAELPAQEDGAVVLYRIRRVLEDGSIVHYPNNPADPYYEMFVGHVEPLYCTDFEVDPALDGWTHDLASGSEQEGADDWQWGAVESPPSSGDPLDGFSGSMVYGNDLGSGEYNGEYQSDKVNYTTTPLIDTSGYASVRLQYRRWLSVEDAHFDQASIYADGELVWRNLDSQQGDDSSTHHRDREWRFHDVDLSAAATDGAVQVMYELSTDGGLEMGGWTIDDLCIVGFVPTVCGDGQVTGVEECDDGEANSDELADACRDDCVEASCGDGVVDSGEDCDDGNENDIDGCDQSCQREDWEPPVEGNGAGGPAIADVVAGCGCRLEGTREPALAWWVLVAVGGLVWRRRGRA